MDPTERGLSKSTQTPSWCGKCLPRCTGTISPKMPPKKKPTASKDIVAIPDGKKAKAAVRKMNKAALKRKTTTKGKATKNKFVTKLKATLKKVRGLEEELLALIIEAQTA